MSESPTIIVTGVAGFIASHLTERLLAEGWSVVGVDSFNDYYERSRKEANVAAVRQTAESSAGRFELIEADIRDRQAMLNAFESHKPKAVVHLAAMAGVRPSIADPALYTSVNLDGTVNLLDGAVAAGAERFLFGSSSSVYGNNEKVPFAEDDRVDYPISPYAATKRAGELICHTYHHIHRLNVHCLRFFTVFGPRQRPDLAISKFLRAVAEDRPIAMFGDGTTSRDYTFVGDIVDGLMRSLSQCGAAGRPGFRIYNLGGNEPVSLREMIAVIGETVGKEPVIDQQPMQPGDVDRTYADLTRSGSELGYQPQTSFRDGVAKQWAWMQAQGLG